MTMIVFDLETTGLGNNGERIGIVQIAAAAVKGGIVIDKFHEFLQIPAEAVQEEFAMKMHAEKGRTEEWFAVNGTNPSQVLEAFVAWVNSHSTEGRVSLCGHNIANFDVPHLKREINLLTTGGWAALKVGHHLVDTCILAYPLKQAGKVKSCSLKALVDYFGIVNADAHDAMADVEATVALHDKLMECYAGLGL